MKRPKAKWGWKEKDRGSLVVPFTFPRHRRATLLHRKIPEPVVAAMKDVITVFKECLRDDAGAPTRHEIMAALRAIQKPVTDLIGVFAKVDDVTRNLLIDYWVMVSIDRPGDDGAWGRAKESIERTWRSLDTIDRAIHRAVKCLAAVDGRGTQKGLQRELAQRCAWIFWGHGLEFTAAPKGQACVILAAAFAAFDLKQDPRPYIREIIAENLARNPRAAG